jgi:hypothetical protein
MVQRIENKIENISWVEKNWVGLKKIELGWKLDPNINFLKIK